MKKMTMNDQLKRVALVGFALIAVLMINANYIQAYQSEDLRKHKFNNRQHQGIFLRARGDIYSADKVKLAFSEKLSPDNDKSKYQRRYPKGAEVFVPVTGYFTSNLSKGGVELSFDSILDGQDERQTATSWIKTLAGEKPLGGNVYTTVDSRVQQLAYQRLTSVHASRAAAVVIEADTGAIKVAAGYPSFDPSTVADIQKPDAVNEALNKLMQDKNQPMVNKAYAELFPPGSSFKTVVAAAFLSQSGNSMETPVPAPDEIPTGGSKPIGNSHNDRVNCGLPTAPLIRTFAHSCNTTYALLGADDQYLGNSAVHSQSQKFGFYERIPIEDDLTAPASEYPHGAQGRDEIMRGSFGQGETKTTVLQMAMIGAAIANGGDMMKPYLVDKAVARVEGEDGKAEEAGTIYKADPTSMGKPISNDSAGQLQEMMRRVISDGTAGGLQGRNIAGKTGTTELTTGRGGAWLVGFAPADKPKYGFAVFVEGGDSLSGAGSAGPIAADVLNALMRK